MRACLEPTSPGTRRATRAGLLDVESYTVDLDLDHRAHHHLRLHDRDPVPLPRARRLDLRRPRRRDDPRAHPQRPDARPRRRSTPTTGSGSTTWPADNELRVVADCAYSRTGEGLHRFVDPADDRVYLYTQFEVPDARRVYTTFEQPDLKSVFTLHGDRARRTGWSSPTRPTPEPVAGRRRHGGVALPRRPSGCRRTSPRSSPASTTRSTTPTTASTARSRWGTTAASRWSPYLDADELRRGHQAGLRVLRGGLRLPLPVPQVRPALRAGVQHGRDGERRLRDLPRRVPPPQPADPLRSTSSAPTPSCTRWRTCGSATSSR